jgi:ABC-type transport system involved in multi-copper enzyme maturation permease subunit
MEWNPVFRRESRVRWRGNRAFALLLLLAASLSVVMAFSYHASELGGKSVESASQLTRGGREIFRALSLLQLAVWLLIVPALAAPGLAFERERGLLESLQLSGMTARRIVLGKFAAVMLYALLLLVIGAPPLALCFLLGGVAPEEFLGIFALQTTTIFCGAALGTYFSARARRPQQALLNTFVILVLFLLVTSIGPELFQSFLRFLFLAAGLELMAWLGFDGSYSSAFRELHNFNPFALFNLIFYGNIATASGTALADFIISLGVALLLSALLLVLATLQAGRALPEAQWVQRRRYLTLRGKRLAWAAAENTSPADAAQQLSAADQSANQRETRRVWDVPLVAFVRFANPVLQREVRGLMRLRRTGPLMTIALWMVGALSLLGYAWALMWMLGYPEARFDVWQMAASLAMIIILLAAPLRGANAIARERENGTWENLRLSLLEPRLIVRGKALAPLALLCGALLITAPLWLLSTLAPFFAPSSGRGALTPGLVLGTLALLFSTTFLLTSWGLWISWHCRSSAAAMGWALSSLLVGFFGLNLVMRLAAWIIAFVYAAFQYFVLGVSVNVPYYGQPDATDMPVYSHDYESRFSIWGLTDELSRLLNPWGVLQAFINHENRSYYSSYSYYGGHLYGGGLIPSWAQPFAAALLYIAIGWFLLWHLERRLKRTMVLEGENRPHRHWLQRLKNAFKLPETPV